MTELKFQLLSQIYHTSPQQKETLVNLLNAGFDTPVSIQNALADLKMQKHLRSDWDGNVFYLTSEGRIAYEQAQEERCQQAEQKRQQRFDNKISIASVLIPCITFILGLVLGSQFNLVDWLISLFSK